MVEIWGKFALDFLCYIKNIKILFQNKGGGERDRETKFGKTILP
jgi:hypothetical protein